MRRSSLTGRPHCIYIDWLNAGISVRIIDMEKFEGYINHFLFQKAENGYGVFELDTEDDDIICVGYFPGLKQGETVEVTGEWTEHPTYGPQLKCAGWKVIEPSELSDMERYLGSGVIKGVGPTIAKRIIKKFGKDSLEIIEKEPERLIEIKGISERIAMDIATQVATHRDLRNAILMLSKYGITNYMALKLYDKYGPAISSIITQNPYKLAEDIEGIGFKKADEIASKVGIAVDSQFRIRSGITYTLSCSALDGHTYLPMDELITGAYELLGVSEELIKREIPNMLIDKQLIVRTLEDDEQVYSSLMFYEELGCARMLHDLDADAVRISRQQTDEKISEIERETGIELDPLQRQAVSKALQNGVFILTGGPGTGKTTTINTMLKLFEAERLNIMLAAPTGRAAKRMTETTGFEAKTIHRLLELNGALSDEGDDLHRRIRFERNDENPLEADVVIIDESSMVDIHLFYALLKALKPGCRLILVGDYNQLPSVGPGQVLHDLIDSGCYACVELTRIFRQAEQSDIVVNAHKINRGEEIALDNKSKDFFFLERDNADVIYKHMVQLITEKLPGYVNASPMQIQVLTPTRKGPLGVESLNRILQKYINPPAPHKREYTFGETVFREGDKVMQIKNNYNIDWKIVSSFGIVADTGTGVFNGDIGVIGSIDRSSQSITVDYDDGKKIEYPFSELEQLELAYAVTIHKSQGSEYPAVIMPLLGGPKMLLNRNLLYTGVTRAIKCVTILGSRGTLSTMIHNVNENSRYTGLAIRIKELEGGS